MIMRWAIFGEAYVEEYKRSHRVLGSVAAREA
jgi:hypothetical protein